MNFELLNTPKIIFGQDKIATLTQLLPVYGKKVLFIVSKNVLDLPLFKNTIKTLNASNLQLRIITITREPTSLIIDQNVQQGREFNAEVIVGVGGGSVLDAAKAIAGLIPNNGSILDYLEVVGKGLLLTKPAIPLIACPTTAGTGSEVTKNAVVTVPEHQFKASLRSPFLIPQIALIDPTLIQSVPPSVIASTGMDALTQLIESYTSNHAQLITDSLAELGIKKISTSLKKAYLSSDIKTLEDMAFSALLSGICLANAGLGAVHGFASPLGG